MNRLTQTEKDKVERKLSIAIDKMIDVIDDYGSRIDNGLSDLRHALDLVRDARSHITN